ncbi:MAG: GNAT family N-acetyltransferase [Thermomicrobiales bacterium]
MTPIVRPATLADLPAAASIKAAGSVDMNLRAHPALGIGEPDHAQKTAAALALFTELRAENPEQVWVATAGDIGHEVVCGMAAAVMRGRHAHIVAYFVDPARQGRGLGRALFTALLDACRRHGCDILSLYSSDDPRAMTHYLQHALWPQPPHLFLVAARLTPPNPAASAVSPLRAEPITDEATLNTAGDIDKAVRGVRRMDDLRRWVEEGDGLLLVDRLSGVPAGYAFLRDEREVGRVGPVAANAAAAMPLVLAAALREAASRPAAEWRAFVPGENHAALATLLAWGFRAQYAYPYMATAPIGQPDRYLLRDFNLL